MRIFIRSWDFKSICFLNGNGRLIKSVVALRDNPSVPREYRIFAAAFLRMQLNYL